MERGRLKFALYDNNNPVKTSFISSENNEVFGVSGALTNGEFGFANELGSFEKNFKKVSGTFSYFSFGANAESVFLANDPVGSKQIFYYDHDDFFLFSSSIFWIKEMLKKFGKSYQLFEPAAYMLLSMGYLLEDFTLIDGVKKLTAGKCISVKNNHVEIAQYHSFYEDVKHHQLNKDLIHQLDLLFKDSLDHAYSFDIRQGKSHLSTLSGGLDSRLTLMLGHKYGFRDITALTFSQGYTDDETVARRICEDLKIEHMVLLQNGGSYLLDVDTPLILNNCSVYYFGAAQTYNISKKINFDSFGLAHHGGLAESSKGGYLFQENHTEPRLDKRYAVSARLFDRIPGEILDNIFKNYPTDEMFVTYNRGFNAIHNGNWMMQPFAHTTYPYMEANFASLAYSISPKLRYNARLTIDWLNTNHPDLAKYPWHYGIPPTKNQFKIFGAKVYNKVVRQFTNSNNTYIPLDYWYSTNGRFKSLIDGVKNELEERSTFLPNKLFKDIDELYSKGNIFEKMLCLSLVRSIALLFD
ncbi:hypothetical protein [Cecembia lonarensis]|uniref:hypothetical protein n=1 Tax=Cecembia lonarensis TaxID=645110 RepID=UPI0012FB4E8C|nr:hypothetical protein [Cecembia lonarensis]